ncbi:MAG: hypothetical protein F6K24_02565 [Okeania sp. SIO2D1]|nr:hypothetical protein [Okeania sp. SIO2D1]
MFGFKGNKKAPGLIEYLLFNKTTLSAILASLLMASFLSATILPFVEKTPVNAEQSK